MNKSFELTLTASPDHTSSGRTTLTAILIENGMYVYDAPLDFIIFDESNSAMFVNGEKKITVNTNTFGEASTELRNLSTSLSVGVRYGSLAAIEDIVVENIVSTTKSTLTAEPATILANGNDISKVTFIAKDEVGNLITGLSNRLLFYIESGIGLISGINESPTRPGVYEAELTSATINSISIVPFLDGVQLGNLRATVDVVSVEQPLPANSLISVNNHFFTPDSGFPTTGFEMATFQIYIGGNAANNSIYSWSTDKTWLTISQTGTVTFIRRPTAAESYVTIRARSATNISYVWHFDLKTWFIFGGSTPLTIPQIEYWAQTQGGVVAHRLLLTNDIYPDAATDTATRSVGKLFCEWGAMKVYNIPNRPINSFYVWTPERPGTGYDYAVDLNNGNLFTDINTNAHIACCYVSV